MSKVVDVKFIQPFLDGAIATLKVQCHLEAKQMKPYLKQNSESIAADIAGIIGISSEGFHGSIAVCFPEKSFLAVMSGMLGESYTSITPDIEDGAGELTNIIFGYGKRVLSSNGYQLQKALPSVVRGSGLSIKHRTSASTIVVPFECTGGPFHIEVSIEPLEKAS